MNIKLLTKDLRPEIPPHIRPQLLRPLFPFGTATLTPFAAICLVPFMAHAGNFEKPQTARGDAQIGQNSERDFAQNRKADGSSRAKNPQSQQSAQGQAQFRKAENLNQPQKSSIMSKHPYLGTWITDDGHVRHQLLAGGRYDEARGKKESAYRGRYEITGNHIEYLDDTGFTADGDFVDGVLYHGGMVFRRVERDQGADFPRSVD